MVETSVAVATPPPTALRMMKGKTKAGEATNKNLPTTFMLAFLTLLISSKRAFQRASATNMNNSTMAITKPL